MIPLSMPGLDYLEFLPKLAALRRVKRYLEIGVNAGGLLARVSVDRAIGVDPHFVISHNVCAGKKNLLLLQETSDSFFCESNRITEFFGGPIDLAFLDGMHMFEYLLRDFFKTEALCSESGLIVLHDCLPLDVNMTDRSQDAANALTHAANKHAGWWTGDVWKIIPILAKYRPNLRLVFFDCYPTGLVCVTNLDPNSRVLRQNYFRIVEEAMALANDEVALAKMYSEITLQKASDALVGFDHTLTLIA